MLCPRETPLHLGHLRLMAQATEQGAVVLPPVMAFYHRPESVRDLIDPSLPLGFGALPFRPNQVIAVSADPDRSAIPLLHARTRIEDRATAYVCRGFDCQRPVTAPAELVSQLTTEPAQAR